MLKPVRRILGPSLLGLLVLVGSGCRSMYSHINRPLPDVTLVPDCRATAEITQPRGEEDVLMILCFSGGGSRASWFSAAAMLRLERVVEEVNLLHEVDVISSVSGGSLPAAYYCLSRDPGPYSVVRVRQLPESLPSELAAGVQVDRRHSLLGFRGKMSAHQRDLLRPLFLGTDQGRVDRLFWLSHHTHAPEMWEPETVRDLMTRDYITRLLWAICVPRWHYWCTGYDRSDMMSKIFVRHLFGNTLVEIPKPLDQSRDLEYLGWLDRCPETGAKNDNPSSAECDEQILRWPKAQPIRAPVRLDWKPGDSPTQPTNGLAPGEVVTDDHERIPMRPGRRVAYRFKDLNPERPYLILNATDGTEDRPGEPHFGQVFPFTREEFKQHLNSSVDTYEVAHAVMASAAFPGVFAFVTLRDFRPEVETDHPRYMHVFDGGNADNLGLESAKKIILANKDRYRHFVVLLVDSRVTPDAASAYKPDVRNPIVDFNFLTSFSTLLDSVRGRGLEEFNCGTLGGHALKDKLTFWHLTFDDVRDELVRSKVNTIPTTFKISRENAAVIDQCVVDLIRPDHPKLQEILRVLRVSSKTRQPESVAGTSPEPTADIQAPASTTP